MSERKLMRVVVIDDVIELPRFGGAFSCSKKCPSKDGLNEEFIVLIC